MHIAICIFTIFAAWRFGDWRNWQGYHTTLLYVAMSNLLYNFIYANHLLWQLKPLLLSGSHNIGEMLYTFIIFPSTALILLTDYPENLKLQIFRILKFVTIYIVLEWAAYMFGFITYNYGWNMWWSLAWDCMMFPIWVLHYKKPLISYIISIFVVTLVLILFPVPMK